MGLTCTACVPSVQSGTSSFVQQYERAQFSTHPVLYLPIRTVPNHKLSRKLLSTKKIDLEATNSTLQPTVFSLQPSKTRKMFSTSLKTLAAVTCTAAISAYMLYSYQLGKKNQRKSSNSSGAGEQPNNPSKSKTGIQVIRDLVPQAHLGAGTFGSVSLVTGITSGIHYALKSIASPTIPTPHGAQLKQQIGVEIGVGKYIAPLNRFLLTCEAAWRDDYSAHLLTPLCHGGSLESFFPWGFKCDSYTCRFIVAELVSAVSCLHQNRIVHRDLKLDNMLVTRTGHIRVADFGGSVKLEVGQTLTSVAGTITYMAPEVMNPQTDAGLPSDIWSLGAVLYRLLTGIYPCWTPGMTDNQVYLQTTSAMWRRWEVTELQQDPIAFDLLKAIFMRMPGDRPTITQIRCHEFFSCIDWEKLEAETLESPLQRYAKMKAVRPRHSFLLMKPSDGMRAKVVELLEGKQM